MTPRKRVYKSDAERVAAHRARLAKEGRVQLNLTVTVETATWFKKLAAERGVSHGQLFEQIAEHWRKAGRG